MSTLPDWLANSEHGPFLQCILTVAWADGMLEQSERDMIAELVTELELSPTEAQVKAWLATRPDPQEAAAPIDDYFTQIFLLRQALLMAAGDGHYAESEKKIIESWATQWEFDMEELLDLMTEVQEQVIAADRD